ncbi:hypothetical protein COT42_01915 [Candidatus Saganbacteria bacterium CG08_land_8_20_14_0_20_45_16]|uniref:Uncharacterized protein n=1 Tax=Candidatus Saganbacteria bacterium CG08_land_8_20_14_0_20_45_16 TaxID=2014293 RepID=A0A2H0Y0Q4_UNCSA|nr:MAG: hypothetical protein COT42_01915 [Candidatus Saganbacteria bacterium CG08_land_8_20_14_0_20_45_16]
MQGLGKEFGYSFTLGIEITLPTILGAVAGYYIDKQLTSSPVGLIIGVFFGAAVGLWTVVKKFVIGQERDEK